ncbi:MAG: hypothetical protein HETSPECPRED_006858 [Heterodermia speciosa]|uniref:Uncharacterized protein n=1 Tax=Heterodermia speciosa TaxID=116794 RepID=A0A8H3IPF9_9LECA|nr:MAG: hypothetical protein HETSPECPRED_006858 [Heterodermia speciosa]
MHPQALLLLAISSFVFASPLIPAASTLQTRQFAPPLAFPGTLGAADCPDVTVDRGNPWANYWAGHDRRRSLDNLFTASSPTRLDDLSANTTLTARASPFCELVARITFDNWPNSVGNTNNYNAIPLAAGQHYSVSFACEVVVHGINIWAARANGHFDRIAHGNFNQNGGVFGFTVTEAELVHVEVLMSTLTDGASGEVALFQTSA